MVVEVDHPALASKGYMVLKLYDRRWIPEFRIDGGAEVWTPKIENEFNQFMNDSRSAQFLVDLQADKEIMTPYSQQFSDAQSEAFMNEVMRDLYKTEVRAYDTLSDVQGNVVPRLFGLVTISSSPSVQPGSLDQHTAMPGLLLQYVRGFSLEHLASHAPRALWQGICDDALQNLQVIGKRGVLDGDVHARNVIVKKFAAGHYKPFIIDFAISKFRADFDDEKSWRKAQAEEDEEGELGHGMERILGGGFVYRRTAYSRNLSDE
jgi:hypothetical protein